APTEPEQAWYRTSSPQPWTRLNGAGPDGAGTVWEFPVSQEEHVLPQWSRPRRSRNRCDNTMSAALAEKGGASMEPAPTEPEQAAGVLRTFCGQSPHWSRPRRSRNSLDPWSA